MIKGVLLDLDGTLVDSNGFHVEAWHRAFGEHGFTVDPTAIAGQIGKGGDLLVPALLPDLSPDVRTALAERHGAIFKADYLERVRPFDAAHALLARLHVDGKRLVLASSAHGAEIDHHLDLLDARDLIEAATGGDDVATSKPAPDVFAAALAKLPPLTAREVLMLGDTPYDAQGAAACGIATVGLRSGGFGDATLAQAGVVALYDDVAALLAAYAQSPFGSGAA